MSRGNAEQPSAQTPKGPGSPNRVETAVQGRPENGPQGRPEAAVQNGPQRGIQDRQQPGPQGNPQARNPQEGGKGDSKGAGPQGGGAQGGGPQGGNPQGRGPQGGSPQAGGPQGGSAQSGNPQARVGGPQARSEQPNAQQPPQRTPDVKTPGPQQPSGGPSDRKPTAGPVAGATGKRSGRGAQEFQRANRPRRAGCSHAYGRGSCCSWRRRAARFRSRCPSTAAWRPATRWSRKWRHGAAEAGAESAGAESAGTGNQAQPPAKTAGQGATRSPRPSLVLRLRVVQPVPARQLRARKPRARYPYGIRLRLHRPSSRSSLDWGLGRRPSRWRATRPLHPYSRHRRHRPQPLSRRANSPQRPSR